MIDKLLSGKIFDYIVTAMLCINFTVFRKALPLDEINSGKYVLCEYKKRMLWNIVIAKSWNSIPSG